jgi:hypothetical protein
MSDELSLEGRGRIDNDEGGGRKYALAVVVSSATCDGLLVDGLKLLSI